ncbi:hypothetical protein PR001_g21278 [Phytophthora rubi]|uniref:Integrase catalytic domain-containing protein n=1 Tax=Phytophthora rubi TaxID=129364 RepID=A0A6A3J9N4_9STRA|nr:hypothetical protein PR001_g21278 [Phytophthora rubi]
MKGSLLERWTPRCEAAFQRLKDCLAQAPLLHHYDDKLPLFLACDASNVGVGAVLFQRSETEDFRLLACFSSTLKGGQRNYSATQRELLAVIYGMRQCHDILWGRHFALITDHQALVYMVKQERSHIMLLHYFDTIISYDFDVIHCPGVQNVLPDALCRLYPAPTTASASDLTSPVSVQQLISLSPRAALQELRGLRLVEDAQDRQDVVAHEHAKGHFGTDIILENIVKKRGLCWPSLRRDCEGVCKTCVPCQRFNVYQHGFNPLTSIDAENPFDHVSIDLGQGPCTSSLGNNYFLLVVDICTRFVLLRPLRTKTSEEVACELFYLFTCFGLPKILQSDNGTEFVNSVLSSLTAQYKVDHRVITPYNPRANGTAEVHVKVTKSVIYKTINGEDTSWDRALAPAQLAINTRISRRHGSSPFAAMFGRQCNEFADYSDTKEFPKAKWPARAHSIIFPAISKRALETEQRDAERHDNHHRMSVGSITPGMNVMAVNQTRGSKAEPRDEGPFKVIRVNAGGAYVLQGQTGSLLGRNYALSQLKPVPAPQYDDLPRSLVVKSILNHRGEPNARQYLVHWAGFPDEADSWEPPSQFDDVEVIRRYWKNRSASRSVGITVAHRRTTQLAATIETAPPERRSSRGRLLKQRNTWHPTPQ